MMKASFSALAILYICLQGVFSQGIIDKLIEGQMKSFLATGNIPPLFTSLTRSMDFSSILQNGMSSVDWTDATKKLVCSGCTSVANELYEYYQDPNVDHETFFQRLSSLCTIIVGEQLCNEAIMKFKPIFIYVLDNADTNGNDICGTMFRQLGCKSNHTKREWKIRLPDKQKPPVERIPYPKISEVETSKILLLTDIHYDRKYTPGSNAACDDIHLCCHSDSRGNRTKGDEAGFWGDYRVCDVPKRTVELLLKDAAERHPDIDLIISLGDHLAHDIGGISKTEVLEVITETFDLIEKYFPGKQLLPVIGNHDVEPFNSFAPPYITDPELSTSWLYKELHKIWLKYLPSDITQDSHFHHGGYYSTYIMPGLKAISINSNYGYIYNWWLILDSKDVAGNLQFLVDELQKVEDNGERAYILTHMSPGSTECDQTWSREFNKIINRYENVIAGLFHGHSHNDFFEIYFDSQDNDRPYAIGYTAPSLTTYSGLNPGYKIHTIEGNFSGSNFRVLDGESYILDLKAANEESRTDITKLYSALEDYQLMDMSPESMLIFVKCMQFEENQLFERFFRNFHKNGSNLNKVCNPTCKDTILCNSLITDISNPIHCSLLNSSITNFDMRSPATPVRCGEICYKNCDNELVEANNKISEDKPMQKDPTTTLDIKLLSTENVETSNTDFNYDTYDKPNEVYKMDNNTNQTINPNNTMILDESKDTEADVKDNLIIEAGDESEKDIDDNSCMTISSSRSLTFVTEVLILGYLHYLVY